MFINKLESAAVGWKIISSCSEAREGARHLLLWLAENIVICSMEFQFVDEQSTYSWIEGVKKAGNALPPKGCETTWRHPFPSGSSSWKMAGFQGNREELCLLLNLLADQWLRVFGLNREKNHGKRLLRAPKRTLVNPSWIAVSRTAREIRSRLTEMSFSTRPLLLLGENGSGKRYLAELIHNTGPFPSDPFSRIDSFENTGTLYVPDWQLLATEDQENILKDKRRLIASAVPGEQKTYLQERWYVRTGDRRSIVNIPPLRNHSEDIPLLSGRFLEQNFINTGQPVPGISAPAMEALKTYSWPGNIRELKETMAWSVERSDGKRIRTSHLPPAVRGSIPPPRRLSCTEQLSALEYEVIREELSRQKGNITRAAEKLGLSPRQMSCRIKKYKLNPRDFKNLPDCR